MNSQNLTYITPIVRRKFLAYISLSITLIVIFNTSLKVVFTSSPQGVILELNPPSNTCNPCNVVGHDFSQSILVAAQQKSIFETKARYVSRVEYERLKLGMSLGEVEAILDRGIEIKQSANSTTFIWENEDKSGITVTFEGGKLMNKMQSRLR